MGFFDDVGDFLLGTKPKAKVKQKSLLSKEQQVAQGELLKSLQGPVLGRIEETSLEGLEQAALQRVEGPGPAFDEFFKTSVQDPLLEDFEETILPRISRRFAPSGFHGSERQQADRFAKEDLLKSLTRSRSELAFGSRESELNQLLAIFGARGGRADQLQDFLRTRTTENIVKNIPGTKGLINTAIESSGDIAKLVAVLCWVAREVYGSSNPAWIDFRYWMLNISPSWLLTLYLRYGERTAMWLRGKPRIKRLLRVWMDSRIRLDR